MATPTTTFPYPALPKDVDAIRILKIHPGDFPDDIVGTLTSVSFNEKPKYVALSYTWEASHTDITLLPMSEKTQSDWANLAPSNEAQM
jgi:hypothetical protein